MTTTKDYNQLNLELMSSFNQHFIETGDTNLVPRNAVLVFIPDEPDHRRHNIEAGMRMIEKGFDVYFKHVTVDENRNVIWSGRSARRGP